MSDYGTVIDKGTIRFERLLPADLDTVWAFVVEPDKRAQWLAGGAVDQTPGGKMELIFENSKLCVGNEEIPDKYKKYSDVTHMHGTVLKCEPKRLFVHSWVEPEHGIGGDLESEVTFELTPKGGRTLLVLTHRRLPEGEVMKGVLAGWHNHLRILIDRLSGRAPAAFWSTHMALEDDYHRRLNMG